MKNFLKILFFILFFSAIFYWLRTQDSIGFLKNENLIINSESSGWLYSIIGMFFAIFSGFVILTEAERWGNLINTVKKETGEIKELWLWSHHLSRGLKNKFEKNITDYLKDVVSGGWSKGEGVQKSIKSNRIFEEIHEDIYLVLKKEPDLMPSIFETFTNFLNYRERRIHYISFHLPKILRHTLIFSCILIIVFSLLIGMPDIYLDYIFTLGIAVLSFVIYLVVEDLDNPIKPGGWHITTKDYQDLLNKINKGK